jgi:hypothetical protein
LVLPSATKDRKTGLNITKMYKIPAARKKDNGRYPVGYLWARGIFLEVSPPLGLPPSNNQSAGPTSSKLFTHY